MTPLVTLGRHVTIMCVCFLALTSIQCRRDDDRTSLDDSTVTVLYQGDEWALGPENDGSPQHLVFLTMVTIDEVGRLHGRLVERWEHSPDYRTWTFHLRTDVRWHDGVPVTAHDIKFTVELWAHPEVLWGHTDIWRYMESFIVLDDFTYKITYKTPRGALDYWVVFYPKHLLKDLDPKEFYHWEFWTHPVGNGPYRYVRHVPKTMIELEANPDFYKGKPTIERVVLKYGGGAPLTELLSGNVDAIAAINAIDITKLAADPRFRVYHGLDFYWLSTIYWNHQHPLFRDPMVRRALTLAINRRELHQALNLPEDLPLFDVIFTDPQFRRRELPEPLSYDPELAKQLLEAAGWRDRNGDGVRERTGEVARFTAIVAPGAVEGGQSSMEQPVIYVQEQLRRVGIRMDVQILDRGLVQARLRAGEFNAAFFPLANWPTPILHNKWFGEGSPIGYNNPELIKLLQAAEITIDPDARDQVYRKMMDIFRAELPFTFLLPNVHTVVAHRRLRGLSSPHRADPLEYMEDLWIEDEE